MIQDYSGDLIRRAVNAPDCPYKKSEQIIARMIAVRDAARSAPQPDAPGLRPSTDDEIFTALVMRANDLSGMRRKEGYYLPPAQHRKLVRTGRLGA